MYGGRVTGLMAVEVFQIAVKGIAVADTKGFADTEVGGKVVGGTVVIDLAQGAHSALVVGVYPAAAQAALVVEAVMVDLTRHDTKAVVMRAAFAVSACCVFEVAVIIAAAGDRDGVIGDSRHGFCNIVQLKYGIIYHFYRYIIVLSTEIRYFGSIYVIYVFTGHGDRIICGTGPFSAIVIVVSIIACTGTGCVRYSDVLS